MPAWARDMVDLHVHASPSLLPRHGDDRQTVAALRALGFSRMVLKAHEGSTAERALLAGDGAVGGVVLNSGVGGANPEAVEVAARFGARVVWMPTVSSRAHIAQSASPELRPHTGFAMRAVDVIDARGLRPEWREVLDVVAAHDLVLASGHLTADETAVVFSSARERGVRRLLVNHPKMPFLGWNPRAADRLRELGAHLEIGVLPDLLVPPDRTSLELLEEYPTELLVFGGDLGHAAHPAPAAALPGWLSTLAARAGARSAAAIMTTNGRRLLAAAGTGPADDRG